MMRKSFNPVVLSVGVPLVLLLASFCVFPLASIFLKKTCWLKPYLENPAPLSEKYSSFDLAAVSSGFRKFASDIAWIQLLQYVGTSGDDSAMTKEERFLIEYGSSKSLFGINFLDDKKAAELKARLEKEHESFSENKIHYAPHEMTQEARRSMHPDLLNLTLRVVRLDPHFHYAYLFSGGALAWNYDRTDEALEILREGIRNNPDYWQFHLYISAIIYKKNLRSGEMLALLEEAVRQKDAPNMVRVILANYYEKMGRLADALKIWVDVVETKDPMYYEKGLNKIEKFSTALGIVGNFRNRQ